MRLEKYSHTYNLHDAEFKSIKTVLEGRLDNVLEQVESKVSHNDMQLNFKTLNDMLFVKFRQLEDSKQATRDVLTYIKFFYPLQVQ